jgi:hypothetical protein
MLAFDLAPYGQQPFPHVLVLDAGTLGGGKREEIEVRWTIARLIKQQVGVEDHSDGCAARVSCVPRMLLPHRANPHAPRIVSQLGALEDHCALTCQHHPEFKATMSVPI